MRGTCLTAEQNNKPPDDQETIHLYNRLRLWAFIGLGVLLLALTVAHAAFDIIVEHHFDGPDSWLVELAGGVLAAIYGPRIMDVIGNWWKRK